MISSLLTYWGVALSTSPPQSGLIDSLVIASVINTSPLTWMSTASVVYKQPLECCCYQISLALRSDRFLLPRLGAVGHRSDGILWNIQSLLKIFIGIPVHGTNIRMSNGPGYGREYFHYVLIDLPVVQPLANQFIHSFVTLCSRCWCSHQLN